MGLLAACLYSVYVTRTVSACRKKAKFPGRSLQASLR